LVAVGGLTFGGLIAVAGGATAATGQTYYVDVSGSPMSTTCSQTAPCETISQALAVAATGGTIEVGAGTFTGSVTVPSGTFTIAGIPGQTAVAAPATGSGTGVTATAGRLTLSNLKIANFAIGISAGAATTLDTDVLSGDTIGLQTTATASMTTTTINASSGTGVVASGTGTLTVTRSTISNGGTGIDTTAATTNIVDSTITDNTGDGVYANGANGSTTTLNSDTVSERLDHHVELRHRQRQRDGRQ
jgi:hypothetical protein